LLLDIVTEIHLRYHNGEGGFSYGYNENSGGHRAVAGVHGIDHYWSNVHNLESELPFWD
jgi:hypothetical protein